MINRNFKKCLITGINGSGGSFLAELLLKKKIKVYGTYRNKKNNLGLIKNNISLIKCDLNNFKNTLNLIKKIKPEVIFHLASIADVRLSFDKPREIINNNNNCTLNILEAIRISKQRPLVLVCSTSEVYGNVKKNKMPIKENFKIQPINPYAVSKAFQDLIAQTYFKNYGLRIIITRMFTYLNPRRSNLFASSWAKQVAEIEKGKKKILEHGNLNSVRTIIDIKDAMNAYWLAAKRGKIGEIYNIGGNNKIRIGKIINILKKKSIVKFKSKINKKLLRPSDIGYQISCSKKFIKDTNWKISIKLEQSIQNLLEAYRKKII
jgi:GDP-4-dehydro-6-deoxy-D-mannose reductase